MALIALRMSTLAWYEIKDPISRPTVCLLKQGQKRGRNLGGGGVQHSALLLISISVILFV